MNVLSQIGYNKMEEYQNVQKKIALIENLLNNSKLEEKEECQIPKEKQHEMSECLDFVPPIH